MWGAQDQLLSRPAAFPDSSPHQPPPPRVTYQVGSAPMLLSPHMHATSCLADMAWACSLTEAQGVRVWGGGGAQGTEAHV